MVSLSSLVGAKMEHITVPSFRVFFWKDDSSHWYMIPEHLRQDLPTDDIDYDDYEAQEAFEQKFGQYRLDGGIEDITFENPAANK